MEFQGGYTASLPLKTEGWMEDDISIFRGHLGLFSGAKC